MPRQPRIVIQKGGAAGGQVECDSQQHFYVRLESAAYGLPEKTSCGRCMNYAACKQAAADLEKREQEEAAKAAQPKTPETPITPKKG